ncbi:MAG: hypothetical protein GTO53_02160 [Planctomycetales bacterium]|nr:hypothetical protein [Planctomycetales bacterium]NIN07451.1 hypothetical protein [Planctomycetales bacterium]NIO33745.1 hypothetical protein [Planctomycetales bacterium]NIO45567.1 hypothetical protein [Planctomycetales bacterium]NIP03629.1 hypothetical protein [Planctomycetales bacterium]
MPSPFILDPAIGLATWRPPHPPLPSQPPLATATDPPRIPRRAAIRDEVPRAGIVTHGVASDGKSLAGREDDAM